MRKTNGMGERMRDYIYQKYKSLPAYVAGLESTAIVQIFKSNPSANRFFPHVGLSFSEFSVGYCYNLHK